MHACAATSPVPAGRQLGLSCGLRQAGAANHEDERKAPAAGSSAGRPGGGSREFERAAARGPRGRANMVCVDVAARSDGLASRRFSAAAPPARPGTARLPCLLARSDPLPPVPGREQLATCEHLHICVQLASSVMCTHALQADYEHRAASDLQVAATRRLQTVMLHVRSIISFSAELIVRD